MQTQGIYGARVSKTHIDGDVQELHLEFRRENAYRTNIYLIEPSGETIMRLTTTTPSDYVVDEKNWMDVTEMMIKASPGLRKSIKGSGRFENYTITSMFGANNHVLRITNGEGELVRMVMMTDVHRTRQNTLSKGIIFKNEAFFQGGGSLDNYDPRELRFPAWFDNQTVLIKVPSLTKMEPLTGSETGLVAGQELPDKYFSFYLATFKEPLSITEQFNVHLRGNNGYPLDVDLFNEVTYDGLLYKGVAGTYEVNGFITKTIGESFFYFESHDGQVRATIHSDPLKILMKSIKQIIDARWKEEWNQYVGFLTNIPDEVERYYNINKEFVTLVMNAMTDTSKAREAHHLSRFVDFYLEKLA
jgi:hypothetical protein